jgi:hypothetical protein
MEVVILRLDPEGIRSQKKKSQGMVRPAGKAIVSSETAPEAGPCTPPRSMRSLPSMKYQKSSSPVNSSVWPGLDSNSPWLSRQNE